MKILHISKYYPPYRGGIEDICASLARCMDRETIQILCFNDSNEDVVDYDGKIRVVRVGRKWNIASQPVSIHFYFVLRRILKEFDPDVIHFHLPNPLVSLFLLLSIPKKMNLILHWHSDIVAQKFLYFFVRPIEKLLLRRANLILATSPNYVEGSLVLKQFLYKIEILPNIISIDKLNISDIEMKVANLRSVYAPRKIVFFMGRHVPYKGIEYLLKAEHYVKSNIIILLAGEGPLTNALKAKYASDRIKFIGKIKDEEIAIYMHSCDVFAFPSITKNEAFGVVLAEAMYCGAVPITFTIPGSGVNWVSINDETGIEVPNGDVKAYARAIDKLLMNNTLRERYSHNAERRVLDNFTVSSIKSDLYSYYVKLLS